MLRKNRAYRQHMIAGLTLLFASTGCGEQSERKEWQAVLSETQRWDRAQMIYASNFPDEDPELARWMFMGFLGVDDPCKDGFSDEGEDIKKKDFWYIQSYIEKGALKGSGPIPSEETRLVHVMGGKKQQQIQALRAALTVQEDPDNRTPVRVILDADFLKTTVRSTECSNWSSKNGTESGGECDCIDSSGNTFTCTLSNTSESDCCRSDPNGPTMHAHIEFNAATYCRNACSESVGLSFCGSEP